MKSMPRLIRSISEGDWDALVVTERGLLPVEDDQQSLLRHRFAMMQEINRVNEKK